MTNEKKGFLFALFHTRSADADVDDKLNKGHFYRGPPEEAKDHIRP